MSSADEVRIMNARDALALLSRRIYRKYGDEVLPIITEAWSKLGVGVGIAVETWLPSRDLKVIAGAAFCGVARGEIFEVSEDRMHGRSHDSCALGLDNTSRELCQAVMSLDKAVVEAVAGKPVNMKIVSSRAASDEYCEVIYSWG